MQSLNKKLIMIFVIIILSVSLIGCSSNSASVSPPKIDEGKEIVKITGTCTAEVVDGQVKVSVVTDMRSDIIFKLSVTDEAGNVLDELQMTKVMEVDPTASFTIQPDWPDTVYGFLVAGPSDNSANSIVESYGKNFSNITYDGLVYNGGKNYIVFRSEPLNIR